MSTFFFSSLCFFNLSKVSAVALMIFASFAQAFPVHHVYLYIRHTCLKGRQVQPVPVLQGIAKNYFQHFGFVNCPALLKPPSPVHIPFPPNPLQHWKNPAFLGFSDTPSSGLGLYRHKNILYPVTYGIHNHVWPRY